MYAGPGRSQTYWSGSHDSEDLYYGVKVDRPTAPSAITAWYTRCTIGGTGTSQIDTHQDGSVSVHWSVRLIDYNMYTGEVLTEAPSFDLFGRLINTSFL